MSGKGLLYMANQEVAQKQKPKSKLRKCNKLVRDSSDSKRKDAVTESIR